MNSRRLSIGVIGAGIAFRQLHLPNLTRLRKRLEVIAVVASSADSAASASQLTFESTGDNPDPLTDVAALLDRRPDAVLLNVPIKLTRTMALQVLDAQVDLICEKPLGESAEEGAEIARRAEDLGVLLAVCENFRYQSRFHRVRELVKAGAVGEPRIYFLNDLHYTSPTGTYAVTPWRQRGEHRGGYLLDGGSHIVAGLRAMVGETPSLVHAVPASVHPEHLGAPWDTALANLTFGSGIVGHLALGYGVPDREARHPKILGTDGTITLKKDRLEIWRADPSADEVIALDDVADGIAHQWDDFGTALATGRPVAFPAWEAVQDLAVIDALIESAQSGGVVSVSRYAD